MCRAEGLLALAQADWSGMKISCKNEHGKPICSINFFNPAETMTVIHCATVYRHAFLIHAPHTRTIIPWLLRISVDWASNRTSLHCQLHVADALFFKQWPDVARPARRLWRSKYGKPALLRWHIHVLATNWKKSVYSLSTVSSRPGYRVLALPKLLRAS